MAGSCRFFAESGKAFAVESQSGVLDIGGADGEGSGYRAIVDNLAADGYGPFGGGVGLYGGAGGGTGVEVTATFVSVFS